MLALIPAAGLFAIGLYLQPLYGDLTRIGSYAEKDFGWNKPQLEFRKPLFDLGRYDQYRDVVVLGDSFSTTWPNHQWQNHLVMTTGWSVTTLDFSKIKIEQVLGNSVFRVSPPKYLILEWVERSVPRRIKKYAHPCTASISTARKQAASNGPNGIKVFWPEENKGVALYVKRKFDWRDIKLKWVLRYLWHNTLRITMGAAHTDTLNINLSRQAPFSSIKRQSLLVYKTDLSKVTEWRQTSLEEMGCGIENLRKQVEANGYTKFILMVAPDKLTAYRDFVRDNELRGISELSPLSELHPGLMPRLDLALIAAIRQGEQDIYLPDDTHWGSSGHQIAAETLITFLKSPLSVNLATPVSP